MLPLFDINELNFFIYFHRNDTNVSLFFCRFSFSRKISCVVVYFHIFSTCYYCTSSISYFMCSGAWQVEYSRCLVGKANWTNEVRLILSCSWFFILLCLRLIIVLTTLWHLCGVCLSRFDSWRFPLVIYFLVIQLLVAFVASVEIRGDNFGLIPCQASSWEHFSSFTEQIGTWPLNSGLTHTSFSLLISTPFFVHIFVPC